MELIDKQQVQELLNQFQEKPVYLHVETTNGAYASHFDQKVFNAVHSYVIFKYHIFKGLLLAAEKNLSVSV